MMQKLKAIDGHEFDCWIVETQAPVKGGIVILQEIFGVTDQLKGLADRYSKLGYNVAIPALFDRQNPGTVVSFDNAIPGRDMMLAAKLDETMMDIDAATKALAKSVSNVAVMGFCWGGGLAIRAAQTLKISGAVSFYGTRLPQYFNAPLKAPVLGHFGTQDDHIPAEMLDAAMKYFPQMEVHKYNTGHAFANDARPASYDETSANLAHKRTEDFLTKIMAA